MSKFYMYNNYLLDLINIHLFQLKMHQRIYQYYQIKTHHAIWISGEKLHHQKQTCKYFNNASYWRSFFMDMTNDSKHGMSEISMYKWSEWWLVAYCASARYFVINDNRDTIFSLSSIHRWRSICKWMT